MSRICHPIARCNPALCDPLIIRNLRIRGDVYR